MQKWLQENPAIAGIIGAVLNGVLLVANKKWIHVDDVTIALVSGGIIAAILGNAHHAAALDRGFNAAPEDPKPPTPA